MPSHPSAENPLVSLCKEASDRECADGALGIDQLQEVLEGGLDGQDGAMTDSLMAMLFGEGADMACALRPMDLEEQSITVEGADGPCDITLEVARTPAERERGLMGRRRLPEGRGMAFIFEEDTDHPFWMRNTYIPLDAAFLREDGTIRSIKPLTPEDETPVVGSGRVVIELPQGWLQRHGVGEGDRIPLDALMRPPKEASGRISYEDIPTGGYFDRFGRRLDLDTLP